MHRSQRRSHTVPEGARGGADTAARAPPRRPGRGPRRPLAREAPVRRGDHRHPPAPPLEGAGGDRRTRGRRWRRPSRRSTPRRCATPRSGATASTGPGSASFPRAGATSRWRSPRRPNPTPPSPAREPHRADRPPAVKPMSVDEAALRLEASGQDVLVFRDPSNEPGLRALPAARRRLRTDRARMLIGTADGSAGPAFRREGLGRPPARLLPSPAGRPATPSSRARPTPGGGGRRAGRGGARRAARQARARRLHGRRTAASRFRTAASTRIEGEVVAFATTAQPIDFGALDGIPIDLVFLVVSPTEAAAAASPGARARLAPPAGAGYRRGLARARAPPTRSPRSSATPKRRREARRERPRDGQARALLTAEILRSPELEDLEMRVVAGESGFHRPIPWGRIQRPGLALAGFLPYIKPGRIQILGESELNYLDTMPDGRAARADRSRSARCPSRRSSSRRASAPRTTSRASAACARSRCSSRTRRPRSSSSRSPASSRTSSPR